MKKSFLILAVFIFVFLNAAVFAQEQFQKEVLSPAIQFDLMKYKDYFKKSTDYKADLKSLSDYRITCDSDIIGAVWGDKENIKVFDEKNEAGEIINMKTIVFKIKYETYSYIRLYKSSREVVNILLRVNPLFESDSNITLGLCKLEPYRE